MEHYGDRVPPSRRSRKSYPTVRRMAEMVHSLVGVGCWSDGRFRTLPDLLCFVHSRLVHNATNTFRTMTQSLVMGDYLLMV